MCALRSPQLALEGALALAARYAQNVGEAVDMIAVIQAMPMSGALAGFLTAARRALGVLK